MVSDIKLNMLDAMTVMGFMIGLANYEENITQSDLQEITKGVVNDIHEHLKEQDSKMDSILRLLKEGKQNE